jgi:hypothetical protein
MEMRGIEEQGGTRRGEEHREEHKEHRGTVDTGAQEHRGKAFGERVQRGGGKSSDGIYKEVR